MKNRMEKVFLGMTAQDYDDLLAQHIGDRFNSTALLGFDQKIQQLRNAFRLSKDPSILPQIEELLAIRNSYLEKTDNTLSSDLPN